MCLILISDFILLIKLNYSVKITKSTLRRLLFESVTFYQTKKIRYQVFRIIKNLKKVKTSSGKSITKEVQNLKILSFRKFKIATKSI